MKKNKDLVSIIMPIIIWNSYHMQLTTHCLDNIRMFTKNKEHQHFLKKHGRGP